MNTKQIIVLNLCFILSLCSDSESVDYMRCLNSKCSPQIRSTEASQFLQCANTIDKCMIGQVIFAQYANNFDEDTERACISICHKNSCSSSCIDSIAGEDNDILSFNLPIFIIVFGTVLIIIICYIIYVCIKKHMAPQKCEWQIQQEINARNQVAIANQPVQQESIIFPTPLPYFPDSDYYKSCTNSSQLRARPIDEEFANYLYQSAQKKLYGNDIGIPGVIQYGIPLFAFPCSKEIQDLKILEAEIYIPEKACQVAAIEIENLQTNKVTIKSNNKEQIATTIQEQDCCIINIDSPQQNGNENKLSEQFNIASVVEVINAQKQTCTTSVRKQSSDFSRSNKNLILAQLNMRRQTCF